MVSVALTADGEKVSDGGGVRPDIAIVPVLAFHRQARYQRRRDDAYNYRGVLMRRRRGAAAGGIDF